MFPGLLAALDDLGSAAGSVGKEIRGSVPGIILLPALNKLRTTAVGIFLALAFDTFTPY